MSERTVTLKSNESPRFENGVLKWYEFNTFDMDFFVHIKDWGDLEPTDAHPIGDYNVVIEIFNDKGFLIYNESAQASDIPEKYEDDDEAVVKVTAHITSDTTKKFTWGSYTYRIKLDDTKKHASVDFDDIRTVYGQGRIEVELCH